MGNIARKIIPNKTYKNNDGTSNYILSNMSKLKLTQILKITTKKSMSSN